MALKRIAEPTELVVDFDLVKAQLRVTTDNEDDLIAHYIGVATTMFEDKAEISLAEQQWRLTLDDWSEIIRLPRSPVQSIDNFEYLVDGIWTPFTDYVSDLERVPGLILVTDQPSLDDDVTPRIRIEYTSGLTLSYGSGSGPAFPYDIKQAIMFGACHLFEHRGDEAAELPEAFFCIAERYKSGWSDWRLW